MMDSSSFLVTLILTGSISYYTNLQYGDEIHKIGYQYFSPKLITWIIFSITNILNIKYKRY